MQSQEPFYFLELFRAKLPFTCRPIIVCTLRHHVCGVELSLHLSRRRHVHWFSFWIKQTWNSYDLTGYPGQELNLTSTLTRFLFSSPTITMICLLCVFMWQDLMNKQFSWRQIHLGVLQFTWHSFWDETLNLHSMVNSMDGTLPLIVTFVL